MCWPRDWLGMDGFMLPIRDAASRSVGSYAAADCVSATAAFNKVR